MLLWQLDLRFMSLNLNSSYHDNIAVAVVMSIVNVHIGCHSNMNIILRTSVYNLDARL